MVAARLVPTKLGDNQFTEGRSIDPSSQSEAAALLTVSNLSSPSVTPVTHCHPNSHRGGNMSTSTPPLYTSL